MPERDLASGRIGFEEMRAPPCPRGRDHRHQKPEIEGTLERGNISVLDIQFGNVWTNIDLDHLRAAGRHAGQAGR